MRGLGQEGVLTDLFNWTIVPGESNKQVVYDHACQLTESYLRYGYDVILSGLILTYEENGALESVRARTRLLGGTFTDFFCDAPLDVVAQRSSDRHRDVPPDWVEQWWHDAQRDVSAVPWPVRVLDMGRPVEAIVEDVLAQIGRIESH